MDENKNAVNFYGEILSDYGKKLKNLTNDFKNIVLKNYKKKGFSRNLIIIVIGGLLTAIILSVVIGIISVRKRNKTI